MCNRRKASQDVGLLTDRGQTMALLELILLSVLHFEAGISVQRFSLYYRAGDEAVLPCTTVSSSDTTCSNINWLYSRDESSTLNRVQNGNVVKSSVQAARLSLTTTCSLLINNITAEDAGLYTCRQGRNTQTDVVTYLHVLTISPSPPDPERDGQVTLHCSLEKYRGLGPCRENSIRWVDETGAVLLGEGVGYKFLRQTNCVSVLTVKHQSGHNRKYTCQFVDKDDNVKIQADYTPVFTDNTTIIAGAVVGGLLLLLLLLVIITAALIKYRKMTKVTEDVPNPVDLPDEPEVNLTYAMISHENQKVSPDIKIKDAEIVTYSTIRTLAKTEAENDPNGLYSCVSTPQ